MPVYAFEALSADGQSRRGVIEADSARSARAQLRAQALVPIKLESAGALAGDGARDPVGRGTALRSRRVFKPLDLSIWTRQLAGLVSAGLPLERALSSLADEAEQDTQRYLVAGLRAEVNGGATFARALAQHPR
ncbi:MAG: hypothetical protein RL342_1995, partial [Pseudomonadota bacterium]